MNSRPILAALFVLLCLGLSSLVLRQQFAAHPAPVEISQTAERSESEMPPRFPGQRRDNGTWRPATPQERQAVTASIQTQLQALSVGDSRIASVYQSQEMRRVFPSPKAFTAMVRANYPQFGHCRHAQFGPVWTDRAGQHANVLVTATGEDGQTAQGSLPGQCRLRRQVSATRTGSFCAAASSLKTTRRDPRP